MGVKLQSALGGSVELNAPSTASNFTMTVPATDGTVITANSNARVALGKPITAATSTLSIGNGNIGIKAIHMASDGTNDTGGGSVIVMGNSDSGGTNPMLLASSNANIGFAVGTSFSAAGGGTTTNLFIVDKNGAVTSIRPSAPSEGLYPAFMCRAFIRVNQQGTQSANSSGNVSSISDGGVGVTNVNLTTAMPDVNYTVVGGQSATGVVSGNLLEINVTTASQFNLRSMNSTNSANTDFPMVSAAVYR